MAYLIDSNIFIRSKNEMPMNLWPTFWQRMTDMVNSGELFISTKVKEEIERGNDELTEWLKHSAPKTCFVGLDGGPGMGWYKVIHSDRQKCVCYCCRCLFGSYCCCEEYDTGNV